MTTRPPHHRRPDTPARSAALMLGGTIAGALAAVPLAAVFDGPLARTAAFVGCLLAGAWVGWRASETNGDSWAWQLREHDRRMRAGGPIDPRSPAAQARDARAARAAQKGTSRGVT